MKIYLDFETRSQADLRAVGPWAYAQHPSTEVLLVGLAFDDDPVGVFEGRTAPPAMFLRALAEVREGKGHIVAHNAEFEYAVWRYVWQRYHPEVGEPPPWERWLCTAAQAVRACLPGDLARATAAVCWTNRKLTEVGDKYTRMFSNPASGWTSTTRPKEWREWIKYCRYDILSMREMHRNIAEMPDHAAWCAFMRVNERGLRLDRDALAALVPMIEVAESQTKEAFEPGLLTRVAEVKRRLGAILGTELESLRAEVIEPMLDDPELPGEARRLIEARLTVNKASTKKLRRMLDASGHDGRVRGAFVFGRAHTGRHAGAIFQPHNLPREVDPSAGQILDTCVDWLADGGDATALVDMLGGPQDVTRLVKRLIRPCIVPAPGHVLIPTDYNAIEGRLTMWLTGADDWLARFSSSDPLDHPYVQMAAMISGHPPAECTAATPAGKRRRHMGKVTVLGCGYGLGDRGLARSAKSQGLILKPEESTRCVEAFRAGIPQVPAAWRAIDDAFAWCMCAGRVGVGQTLFDGRVTVWGTGPFGASMPASILVSLPSSSRKLRYLSPAYAQLPDGRTVLTYLSPRGGAAVGGLFATIEGIAAQLDVDPKPWLDAAHQLPVLSGWTRYTLWGGKVLENIIQAIAADVLSHGVMRCGQEGLPVVMHVHDEFVPEVAREKAEDARRLCEQIASEVPASMLGIKMAGEATIVERYGLK